MEFDVKGARGLYNVTLDNEMLNLALGSRAQSPSSPSVYVQVKSAFIWSAGLNEAHQKLLRLANCLLRYGPEKEKVSRVDLFADFLWSKPFKPQDINRFVTRARENTTYSKDHKVSGFSFGKGDIRARIYNKTLEAHQSGKELVFDLWGVARDSEVWRVEFQLRREALKSFGVESFDDFLNASQSMWDYCTNKWLSMRAGEGRAKVAPFWQQAQTARIDLQAEAPRVANRSFASIGMNEEQASAQIAGAAKSFARYRRIESSSQALEILLPSVRARLGC
jgi:hypothetical protein